MGFGVSVQNKVCISLGSKILFASPRGRELPTLTSAIIFNFGVLCSLIVFLHFYDIWVFRRGRLTVYLRFSPALLNLLQPQQCAMGYPRFWQRGSGRALKIDAVTAANQKSLTTIQQEVMRSAGFIHQPNTLVSSQGCSPDGDTHALHRFHSPPDESLETEEYIERRCMLIARTFKSSLLQRWSAHLWQNSMTEARA